MDLTVKQLIQNIEKRNVQKLSAEKNNIISLTYDKTHLSKI